MKLIKNCINETITKFLNAIKPSASDLAMGAYSASPDPYLVGASLPLPRTPSPLSDFQASSFGPLASLYRAAPLYVDPWSATGSSS